MFRSTLLLIPAFLLFIHNGIAGRTSRIPSSLAPVVTIESITQVSCFGGSDGAIYLSVQGQGPFTFTWSTGATTQDLVGVPAGAYDVTVSDASLTQVVFPDILVEQPQVLTLAVSTIQHINCLNASGSLSVVASGGAAGYQYNWSNGLTGNSNGSLNAGSYTVTTTDTHGCTATVSATVQQDLTPPTANAGPPQNVLCSNTILQLNGSGSTGASFAYLWTASNGGHIVSGGNTLIPTVDQNGSYTLLVTNTGNGCTAQGLTSVGSQFQSPMATASGGTLNCIVSNITMQATYSPVNNTTYGWTGPNGYSSNLIHPNVSTAGSYIFTVSDTITGCVTHVSALVDQDMVHPTVGGSVNGTVTCLNPTVIMSATSNLASAVFQWTGPNNYQATGAQVSTGTAGTYTVTATNPVNGCTSAKFVLVSGNTTPPTVGATASGTLTCVVASITLTGSVTPVNGTTIAWVGPNGFTSTQLSPAVTSPGIYTLTATSQQNGCSASATVTAVLNNTPPNLAATGGIKTCISPTVTLHASSSTNGATYTWTGPNGYSSNLQHPVVSQTGFYTAIATNPANGCTNSASVSVTANLTIPVLITNTSTITCANPLGKPTATSTTTGTTFVWTGPDGYTGTGGNPLVPVPGFYTVVATNPANGCTASQQVEVFDNTTPPVAYGGGNRQLNCVSTPLQINGTGSSTGNAITYLWTTYDGNILSGIYGLFPRVNAIGTYTLKVTNTQNGCVAMDSIEVTLAPPVTAAVTQVVPVSCNGSATGSATVKAGGGNGAYAYSWSNGSKAATATGLGAGTYTVTVSDSEGCSSTATATISEPALLQAILTVNAQTIYNVNNGSAGISPFGGTSPYGIKWSNGAVTATISNLAPGSYTVTVTDNKGCTLVRTANVNAVNCAMTGSIAATNITCSGAANGSATANLTGGNNPLVYHWSNNASTKTITNLVPGTFSVTVTDANACSVTLTTAITSPDPINLAFASKENVVCSNNPTGLLMAGAMGGTSPYTYTWSNGGNTSTISGLAPGNYTVTLTDAKACTKSLSGQITVTDQTPPQFVLKNATAALNASGVAVLTGAMFDNGSFDTECSIASFTVSPGSFDCSQLGVRTVTLTATDVNGNSKTATATVTITDNIAPALTCPANKTVGFCAAAVQFAAPQVSDNCTVDPTKLQLKSGLPSGSTFPSGKTTEVFSYTDAAGNTGECSFEITVAPEPKGDLFIGPASCNGICDGFAIFTLTEGAVSNNGIQWSNGQSGVQVNGLCAATYTLTLHDDYGCVQQQPVLVQSANTSAFEITASAIPASCASACNGAASVAIAGGAAPFQIEWTNGEMGPGVANLCAGTYSATVTDANGCSQVQPFQINVVDNVAPVLLCPANIKTAYCAATVTYSQPDVQDNCPFDAQQLAFLSGLPSGSAFPLGVTTQTFRYTDAAGNTGQCSFSVTVSAAPVLSVTGTDATCASACNGSANLALSGGFAPFSFLWSDNQTNDKPVNLCAGTYTVTVTDAAGCTQTAQTSIQSPAVLVLDIAQLSHDIGNSGTGTIQITVSGGVSPYTYSWTRNGAPFATTQNLTSLFSGQYAVVVTDAKGCTVANTLLNINNTVAAQEAEWAKGLGLRPNPANRFVRLTLAESLGQDAEVRLVSAGGATLRREALSAADTVLELDLSSVPAGFWLVYVRTADGAETVRKLVVER